MLNGRSFVTAMAVGVLAGALFAVWSVVADQAPLATAIATVPRAATVAP